jgi:hypothetical protein
MGEFDAGIYTAGVGWVWGSVGRWVFGDGVWGLVDDVVVGGRVGSSVGIGGGSHCGGWDDGGLWDFAREFRKRRVVENSLDGYSWWSWGFRGGLLAGLRFYG